MITANQEFIYFISGITLLGSLLAMFKILGKNFILTLPGFFYSYFVVFIFLGSPVFFLNKASDNIYYIISTNLVLLIVPFGILMMNKLMQIDFQISFDNYLQYPIIDKQPGNIFLIPFLLLLGISLSVTMFYFSKLDIIPINYMFANLFDDININELAKLRESSTTTFKLGKLHRYKYFMAQLLPFLAIIALYKTKISKNKLWKLFFIFITMFTMYRCISDLQKKPILDFIILLFLAVWVYRGKIIWKQVGILLVVLAGILLLMYIYIMGLSDRPASLLFGGIASRLFLGQTVPLYYYFSLFPSSHDFLYGTSLPNPAGIFGFENFPITRWIFVNGLNNNWEIVGTAPSAFIGEIYANFGFPIMILSIFLFSMLLQYVQIKFITKRKTLMVTAYYVYFIFLSGQFAMTSFFVVIHLYLIIFIFVAIMLSDGYTILTEVINK